VLPCASCHLSVPLLLPLPLLPRPAPASVGYSPLLQLPDGTVLNAPHVAVASTTQAAGGPLALHPKVLSVAPDRSSVVLALTQGFSQGQPIVYISTGVVVFGGGGECSRGQGARQGVHPASKVRCFMK
jgi:hypothetical protein